MHKPKDGGADREGDDGDDKKTVGRPRVLSPDLDKRHQLRCSTRDFEAWQDHARACGFPNVSAWIRKVTNDALNDAVKRVKRAARS